MLPQSFELVVHAPTQQTSGTRIVWPSDVVAAKNRIDAKFTGVQAELAQCPGFDPAMLTAFQADYSAWRKFYCYSATVTDCTAPDSSIWGLGGQMDDCETWDATAYSWQQIAAAKCGAPTPTPPPTPTEQRQTSMLNAIAGPTTPSNPPSWLCSTLGIGCETGWPDAIKWLAIVALVGVTAWYTGPLIVAAVGAGAASIKR